MGPGLAEQEGPDTKGRRQQDHLRCSGGTGAPVQWSLTDSGLVWSSEEGERGLMLVNVRGGSSPSPPQRLLLEAAVPGTLREVNVNDSWRGRVACIMHMFCYLGPAETVWRSLSLSCPV